MELMPRPGPQKASYAVSPGGLLAEGVHVTEIVGLLRRNLWLLLAVPIVAVLLAAYWFPRSQPTYTAGAAIQVLNARRAVAVGIEDQGTDRLGRYVDPVQNQIELLRGRVVVGRVVDREALRLVSLTEGFAVSQLQAARVDSAATADSLHLRFTGHQVSVSSRHGSAVGPYGQPIEVGGVRFTLSSAPEVEEASLLVTSRDAAIDWIAGGISAGPRMSTDIIDVYFTSSDPLLAQRVVNALVEEHTHWSAEAAQERSRFRRVFLEEQLRNTDARFEDAQLALSLFRGRQQVFSSSERLVAGQRALTDLEMRIEELNADRRMYRSLLGELSSLSGANRTTLRTLVSAPGIAGNPVVTQLYTQLVRYETARDSLTSGSIGHTTSHPNVERLDQLIASSVVNIIEAAEGHVASLEARIGALGELRARNSSEMNQLPRAEAEEVRLVQQVESIRIIGDQLRSELQKAHMAEAVEIGQVEVVYRAPLPVFPNGNRRNRTLALAGILGLVLGVGAAFGREMINTSIRRRLDVRATLQLQELAIIPRIEGQKSSRAWNRLLRRRGPASNGVGPLVPGAAQALTPSAEAFRTLRTNLAFSQIGKAQKSIVITSASPQEGKSTTAVNLAYTIAQQGRRVVLVDADLRRPRLHELLHTPRAPGLACVLRESSTPGSAVHQTSVPGLYVLPSGAKVSNPAELLTSERMRRVLAALSRHFDLVIIDSPPVLAVADASILAAVADCVLLVVRAGSTQRGAAQQAMQQLESVGAQVAGAVLNDPDLAVPTFGDNYYVYGYYAENDA